MKFVPHEYQRYALEWLIQRTVIDGQQGGAFFLDPGLGKTSITLAWLRLLKILGISQKTLIIAPLRVVYSVWPREVAKWDQFQDFKVSIIHGTPTQRLKALATPAEIYLINPEGVEWLACHFKLKTLDFQTLVVDESSKFKQWGAKRTKALKKLIPDFQRRLILTGTPSPRSIEDLFSQMFIVDQGETLGTAISRFQERYFYRGGFSGYERIPLKGSKEEIESLIAHACLRMDAADHLDLPSLLVNDVWVDLPPDVFKNYKTLERKMFLELENEGTFTPLNAGSKYLACKQLANGGLYDADKTVHHIHTAKVEAIKDLVEELNGKPVLIAFQYKHDLERLKTAFGKIAYIDGTVNAKETDSIVEKWNQGSIPILAVQPQAISHGVNMQAGPGRDIVWMGLTDDLEVYLQLNARIHRQGVTGQVRVHRILATRTVDVAVKDRIESKDRSQKSFLEALKTYKESDEQANPN